MRLLFTMISLGCFACDSVNAQQPSPPTCEATVTVDPDKFVAQYYDQINACFAEGNAPTALNLALQFKRAAAATPSKVDDLRSWFSQASAYVYLGNYNEALTLFDRVRRDAVQVDERLVGQSENNAADILIRISKANDAIPLAESSFRRFSQLNDKQNAAISLGTLMQAQLHADQLSAAENTLQQYYDLNAIQPNIHVYVLHTKAQLSLASHDFIAALNNSKEAIDYAYQTGKKMELAKVHLVRAKAHDGLHQFAEAKRAAVEALAIAREQHDNETELLIWQYVAQHESKQKHWQLAFDAQTRVTELHQKLFDLQLSQTVAMQSVLREVEQKEQAIELLTREKSLAQAAIESAEAQRTIALLATVLIVALTVLLYFRRNHRRDLHRAESLNRELMQLHQLKDQFLANTSHELRTPLNGIIGLSDFLLDEQTPPLSVEQKNQLRLIRDCGAQLLDMLSAILDFSQIRAGKPLCVMEPTNLTPVIESALQLMEPVARNKGLKLIGTLAPNLPMVNADADRIRQVMLNLIGNAIKFTDKGQITVTALPKPNTLRITVADTGIGIPAEKRQVIFEPFEQIDGSLRRRHGGVGLGLAISREIIRAHGSEIIVESVAGAGSQFQFTLAISAPAKKI